jgi:hypothetical protein
MQRISDVLPHLVGLLLPVMLLVSAARGDEQVIEQSFGRGPVTGTLRLEPPKPLVGDPVTLTITVQAEKDVELLLPDFGEALDRFTILDFVPRQQIDDAGRTVATQTYRLAPSSSGAQSIPPILIEFVDRRPGQREAPEGEDAYELLTERMDFQVQSVVPSDAQAELRPPLGRLGPRVPPPGRAWPRMVGLLVLLAVGCGALAWAVAVWRRRARRRSAYDIARVRLERLLARPRPVGEQVDAFYVELSGIVRRYLEDRFRLRAPELTTEEFLATLSRSPILSQEHQLLLREFLRQADLVKFAAARPTAAVIETSVTAARQFLDETREDAPLIDVSQKDQSHLARAGRLCFKTGTMGLRARRIHTVLPKPTGSEAHRTAQRSNLKTKPGAREAEDG